jgi:hypothetical protein
MDLSLTYRALVKHQVDRGRWELDGRMYQWLWDWFSLRMISRGEELAPIPPTLEALREHVQKMQDAVRR